MITSLGLDLPIFNHTRDSAIVNWQANAQCGKSTVSVKKPSLLTRTDMEKFNMTSVMCEACRGKQKLCYKQVHPAILTDGFFR